MSDRLLRTAVAARDALSLAQKATGPALDIAVRLWLAQAFWVSGIVKLHDWEQALYLARYEYPVSWLNPVPAAWIGAGIELLCPPLLVLGLATRLAALPMLALVLVAQFAYRPLDAHLVQAALLAWLVVMGAGPLSIDRRLARGLPDSALPFAKPAARLLEAVTRRGGPAVQVALRLLVAGIAARSGDPAGTIGALLLTLGLGSRLVALALIGLMPAGAALSWPLLLGVVAVFGPGPLSLDGLIRHTIVRRWPRLAGVTPPLPDDAPHVVVVGGGFGGLAAVRGLAQAACRVTLIDQRNHHLFQPLLYQVATASLSPADIATPIRSLLRDQANARVLLGRVVGVDTDARAVRLEDGRAVPYDHLVLATGARHGYFGREEWEPVAPGLKKVEDATEIRRRLLLAFEEAENSDAPDERRAFLTFVVVGGGPTGVELAGAIAELARHGLEGEFRAIDPAEARVLLVQSAPRLLPTFPESLSAEAAASLEALGVTVLTGSAVEVVEEGGVTVSGTRIAARTVFWAAGVVASPAARWLGVAGDRAGRVPVGPDLSVPGLPEVFALGDTALSHGWDGQPVPGLAPAAKQGGAHVARVIRARLEGRPAPAPFRYRHAGSLATIGRKAAVADFGRVRLTGAAAWWLWGMVHILFLSGMRNRLGVAVEWFWAYLTLRQGTRLITGPADRAPKPAPVAPPAPALERAS
ncbi:DoxX family membrane protein (plasmid) [Azospirillum brasilense]|uniref:NADH:ubiquinone reductase (non-electrogenic) n=1 Tax=Azospirillum brasilense TaxID=192 RepID=A0A4D8R8G8_AZOBR|nr:FAD-dependent oxidoreductase [Azospirillum brasilense]QCO19368.1 DoxX family membrane protein [Azospirillum brasilense]